jgi:hypothetical protein
MNPQPERALAMDLAQEMNRGDLTIKLPALFRFLEI